MLVRELVALLADADSEDIVIVGDRPGCLLILHPVPGMHQPMEDEDPLRLTVNDREFLRKLRIPS